MHSRADVASSRFVVALKTRKRAGRDRGIALGLGMFTLALLAPSPARASTEWQIRPFAGVTFGGSTTLVDLEQASGHPNLVLGVSGGLLGEIVGVEVDLGHAPGFFEVGDLTRVSSSRVTTLTGNVILGLPRQATEYTLRPYFVGGFGLMQARSTDAISGLPFTMARPALNLGGGVTGPLSGRTGVSWELRHFRTLGEGNAAGGSFGPEQLSFWRANMALVIRY
jgi:hypothetical protein